MEVWWLTPTKLMSGLGFVFFAAAGWFIYFRSKESEGRAVRWLRLAAVAAGCVSVLAALAMFQWIGSLGFDASWSLLVEAPLPQAGLAALLIGLVEEGAKLLSVAILSMFSKHIYRPRVGLILAACTGVGFAMAESVSLMTVGHLTPVEAMARAAASPITHALFAAPFGVGLATWVLSANWRGLALGFFTSVVTHGLYDLLLARPEAPRWAAAAVVLGLWLWMMLRTAGLPSTHLPQPFSIVAVPTDPRQRRG